MKLAPALALALSVSLGSVGDPPAAAPPAPVAATGSGSSGSVAAAGGTVPPEVSVEELEVVVAPVTADGDVRALDALRAPTEAEAGADAGAPAPGTDGTVVADRPVGTDRVESDVVPADGFQTVGLTWPQDADVDGLRVEVRSRVGGAWTSWVPLEVSDVAPDAGSPDAAHATRGGTDPLAVGDADAVQLAFAASAQGGPAGLRLALVGSAETAGPASGPAVGSAVLAPGVDPAAGPSSHHALSVEGDGVVRTAAAAAQPPRVITRAEWGAPAQACAPDVADALVGAVVHHTAGSNGYATVAQAMQQIRNDAAYHMSARGWCDIGYNFIVDTWGNLYEGRAFSTSEAVVGVHAGGFNTGTVGVALLGTYGSAPSAAAQRAVGDIIGWRLGAYGVDPRGTMSYTTGEGENSRYRNETVHLPRVIGHRDVAFTACPGNGGYGALPMIRLMAAEAAAAGWPTPVTDLVRTAANPTVYLVSGAVKHPIGDAALLAALRPVGRVSFVSDAYLASKRTGSPMRRVVVDPGGTVSFVDAGIRLPMQSCAQVADFGTTCAQAVRLQAGQVSRLHPGPVMRNVYRTTSGKAFYVTGGVRREVADTAALTQAGIATASVTLLESGIASLPYGVPVTRDGLVLRSRTTGAVVLSTGGQHVPLPAGLDRTPGLASLPVAALDQASLDRLTRTTALTPVVRDATTGRVYLLTTAGKVHLTDPATVPATPATTPATLLTRIPDAGTSGAPVLFKDQGAATVYALHACQRRPVTSWPDLVALAGSPTPVIHTLPGGSAGLLPLGPVQVPPATLVKAPDNATVYLTDGPDRRITVASMTVPAELGATRLRVLPATDLTRYTLTPGTLTTTLTCGTRYRGLSGRLHPLPDTMTTHYPATTTTVHPTTCTALPRATQPLDRFLRTPDGTIYHLTRGTKHPIGAMTTYLTLGGIPTNTTTITTTTAALFPTGARR